jgi:hypothetical protein
MVDEAAGIDILLYLSRQLAGIPVRPLFQPLVGSVLGEPVSLGYPSG